MVKNLKIKEKLSLGLENHKKNNFIKKNMTYANYLLAKCKRAEKID